ncbi:MAG: dTDP-glucose 4,6-dehydratase [Candidatus Aenigmatarchaeota archaeon]|nr:MAG: dTDP-glucose 4,6-dehydratase [Candidatus Aenigmarchaeota archaeon]
MHILVTGGLGFIGSNFVRYIIDKVDKVYVIDAMKFGSNPNNLKDLDYEFILGDICDYKLMSDLIKKVNVIINFAAETHVDRSISNPFSFIQNNIIGTYTILEAIRKNNKDIKFIHISTDEVYGDIKEGSFKEDDRLKPSSPYSASKASSDMFVLSYVRTYKINALILRCTNNYGPYQFPEKLIPKSIIRILMDMKIPIYGSGKNIRDWIYVEDHCEAIKLLMDKGKIGEIYNISSGEEKTNLEVVKKILETMKKDEDLIEFVEDRPGHDIRYSLDSNKIRKLGWEPKYKFEEGIKKTVKWYLENEWWWRPLIDEKILHPTPWKINW